MQDRVALKFFIDRQAFAMEQHLFSLDSLRGELVAPVLVANADGAVRSPHGYVFPPEPSKRSPTLSLRAHFPVTPGPIQHTPCQDALEGRGGQTHPSLTAVMTLQEYAPYTIGCSALLELPLAATSDKGAKNKRESRRKQE